MLEDNNLTWHEGKVMKSDREALKKHKGAVLWFTGLSGSGKSTISVELEKVLYGLGVHTYRLDGDNVRHGLNSDLGFADKDRIENIRRIGEVSRLFVDAGMVTLTAFISPFQHDRDMVRALFPAGEFVEIYVKASLEACEKRDPKGLYEKVRKGEISQFTGVDSPYEAPATPELVVDTEKQTVEEAVETIVSYLKANGYLG
ncbi:adenylyl-sulfate kinase [Pseudalkalibacillus hwajinpoensis]|uniref:Adenylyl-sulfate kinase n=1 Tax=Guptibacillus hwajinpoensis TaxID=208199 RepID=A0A4U1MIT1_9BACL|nr:adenylyl-sulfate kinase [Pseudalkalibacillus hwajinpoensis]TKD70697.1 adenylyl-sulfate kinase [Pseudalkalibacillus hwajinpoensis]